MANEKEYANLHIKLSKKQVDEIDYICEIFNIKNRTEAMRYLMSVGAKYQKGMLKEKNDT